jgi:hypothetical protein
LQALACRRWPAADLVIVDQVHEPFDVLGEYVQGGPRAAAVIGLCSTPIPGLKLFTNSVTMSTDAGSVTAMQKS